MSQYPAVAPLPLTETETTQTTALGYEYQFTTPNGVVKARYMSHGGAASIAAGLVAGYADYYGRFDTANIASTLVMGNIAAGIVPVSHTTGDFGWVVVAGPLTAGQFQLAATYASSAAERFLSFNAAGALATCVTVNGASTDVSGANINDHLFAILRSTSTTVSSGTASTGIIDVIWG